jgi:hypothetical protein
MCTLYLLKYGTLLGDSCLERWRLNINLSFQIAAAGDGDNIYCTLACINTYLLSFCRWPSCCSCRAEPTSTSRSSSLSTKDDQNSENHIKSCQSDLYYKRVTIINYNSRSVIYDRSATLWYSLYNKHELPHNWQL